MDHTVAKRKLHLLTPAQFRDAWPMLRQMLLPIEDHCNGELLVDDVPALVEERKAFILVMFDGGKISLVGVMEVISYPRKSVMNTIMMAGKGSRYLFTECRESVAHIARALGASCIRGYVRPSVSRLLRQSTPRAREVYSIVEIDL